jgi:hypothetical protein
MGSCAALHGFYCSTGYHMGDPSATCNAAANASYCTAEHLSVIRSSLHQHEYESCVHRFMCKGYSCNEGRPHESIMPAGNGHSTCFKHYGDCYEGRGADWYALVQADRRGPELKHGAAGVGVCPHAHMLRKICPELVDQGVLLRTTKCKSVVLADPGAQQFGMRTSSPSTRGWPGQLLLWLPKLQAANATRVDVSRLTHRKSHR